MGSEAQAGTPDPTQGVSENAANPAEQAPEGSERDAQKWKEALVWKQKAEEYNKVAEELAAERARAQELERIAYGGGRQATDPRAELVLKLKEQAQFDPASEAALYAMREVETTKAELWLANGLLSIPEAKREQVAYLVRNAGYQMSPQQALSVVTDPEAKTLAEKLKELTLENERLKGARPNGVSPAAATPASASADDGRARETIKMSEYVAILQRGGDEARALKQAVGSNKTKLVRE
jgi:hypothetical protein